MHVLGGTLVGAGLALGILTLTWWFIESARNVRSDAAGVADVAITGTELVVTPRGPWKTMSLRRELRVPLADIVSCEPDSDPRTSHPVTLRVGGTALPRLIRAGFMAGPDGRSWWLYRYGENAVTIELSGNALAYLVVEVDDPAATVVELRAALAHAAP